MDKMCMQMMMGMCMEDMMGKMNNMKMMMEMCGKSGMNMKEMDMDMDMMMSRLQECDEMMTSMMTMMRDMKQASM
ncbi:hypothetical protein [Paenibacillus campi]|uniref:hypothetical protein n=1 Tax=Paenibacillus campi TaxID=3106031 RepID=UPI002AFEBEA7|nr:MULTISPECIES: hypothetical protein [unclassified Paenibacillus]